MHDVAAHSLVGWMSYMFKSSKIQKLCRFSKIHKCMIMYGLAGGLARGVAASQIDCCMCVVELSTAVWTRQFGLDSFLARLVEFNKMFIKLYRSVFIFKFNIIINV